MNVKLIYLRDHLEMKEMAARWFHAKWQVLLATYRQSMEDCLIGQAPIPQWYLALKNGHIVGGLGVIENDFHERKDLTPNVCAVYTEPEERGQGIAGALLKMACRDMCAKGIHTLYLLTNHTSFYERYGWAFVGLIQQAGEKRLSRVYRYQSEEDEEA